MRIEEVMEFIERIPCKYSRRAESANKKLEPEDIQRLVELCTLMQDVDNIDADFDTAGRVIAEIYMKKEGVVPELIRKVMYLLVYQAHILRGVEWTASGNIRDYGYQAKIMESVNKYFRQAKREGEWAKNLWSGDKWGMSPYKDFCDNYYENLSTNKESNNQSYQIPDVIIPYAGKKNGRYGYMIKSLVEQVPDYGVFIDAFGGSGAATMNIEPLKGCRYIINDYDKVNVNYYIVLATRPDAFIKGSKYVQDHVKKYGNKNNLPREEDYDDFDRAVWNYYEYGENKRIVRAIHKAQLKQTIQGKIDVGVSFDGNTPRKLKDVDLDDTYFTNDDYSDDYAEIPWGDIDGYDLLKFVNERYEDANGEEITFETLVNNFEFKRYLLEYLLDENNQAKYQGIERIGSITKTLKAIYDHSGEEKEVINPETNKKEIIGNSPQIKYVKGLWYMYDEMLANFRKETPKETKYHKQANVEVAIGFFFRHCFMANGINEEITGVGNVNLKKYLKVDFDKLIPYHERIKYCEIMNEQGQYLSGNGGLNKDNAVFYFDPPYSATSGYEIYFGEKEMSALISGFAKIKGKFIYSCVAGISASGADDKYIKENQFKYDALEVDAYNEVSNKFLGYRKQIAGMFEMFFPINEKKLLYVIFACLPDVSAEEMLEICVSYNIKLEIMITDIDFDIDVINNNNTDNARTFKKISFIDFYKIVKPILKP